MSRKHQYPRSQQQPKLIAQQQTVSYSSPYPTPQMLEAFERFAPGSAREVMDISRKSVESQIKLQEASFEASKSYEFRRLNYTFFIAAIALLGGVLLALLDRSMAAYGVLIGELATLAGAFLYGKLRKE